jgi:hypothetical protein
VTDRPLACKVAHGIEDPMTRSSISQDAPYWHSVFLSDICMLQMLPSVSINGTTRSRPRKPGRTSTTLLQRPSPTRGARSIEVDFSYAYCAIVESHSGLNHLPTSVSPLSSILVTSMRHHNLFLATATSRDVSCAGAGRDAGRNVGAETWRCSST